MIQRNRNPCKDSNIFVYSDFDTNEAESHMWVLKTQPLKNTIIFPWISLYTKVYMIFQKYMNSNISRQFKSKEFQWILKKYSVLFKQF